MSANWGIGDIDLDIYDHIEVVKRLAHDLWASF